MFIFSSGPPKNIPPETSVNEEHMQISDLMPQDGSSEGPLLPILEENISDDEVENTLNKDTLSFPGQHEAKDFILVLSKFISSLFSRVQKIWLSFFSFVELVF